MVAVGSSRKSRHHQSGLRSQVELRLGSVSGDIARCLETPREHIDLSSQVQDMTLVFSLPFYYLEN